MNKILFFALGIIFNTSAFAATVGDQITFRVEKPTKLASITWNITDVSEDNDLITFEQTVVFNGTISSTTRTYKLSWELFFQELANDADQCAQYAEYFKGTGVVEMVNELGTDYLTCHVTQPVKFSDGSDGIIDTWYANVPLGTLKISSEGNATNEAYVWTPTTIIKQ